MSDEVRLRCPRCGGARAYIALVMREGRCASELVTCALCVGSGRITKVQAEALEVGRALSALRQRRDLSLREAAAATGILPVRLSAIEQRGERPTPEEYTALGKAYGVS